MGDKFNQLPGTIQVHLKNITAGAGLPDNEESYEKLAVGWLAKKEAFETQIGAEGLVEVEQLDKDDAKGAVALTYSGSLMLIGPLVDGDRKAAYQSIGIRKNVPESLKDDHSKLGDDIKIDAPIKFEKGPVQSTSAIYKIAVCETQLEAAQEESKLSEATVIITNKFIDINKEIVPV